jgi:hypothetical protein
MRFVLSLLAAATFVGCAATPPTVADGVLVASLGDGTGFDQLRAALFRSNPGYSVDHMAAVDALDAADVHRVAFVQRGSTPVTVLGEMPVGDDVEVGAALALRPLERAEFASPIDLVVFTVPQPLGLDVPTFLRPDFDPRIDDQRGGCATEDKPYRRLLLTWRPENGPYVFHGLNAHRVRIVDSFTHYHPVEGGFDELYLVQATKPGARLITSDRLDRIESPATVGRDEAATLLREYPLAEGDLIFIPRGVVHRGIGGAIVMVITIPGFRPGAEIGVDHHLRAIAERCGEECGVSFNVGASAGPVVR